MVDKQATIFKFQIKLWVYEKGKIKKIIIKSENKDQFFPWQKYSIFIIYLPI